MTARTIASGSSCTGRLRQEREGRRGCLLAGGDALRAPLELAYDAVVPQGEPTRPVTDLEAIVFTRPSRYCDSDRLAAVAHSHFPDLAGEELVQAVRTVAAGDSLLAPRVTRHLVEAFVAGPQPTAPRTEVLDVLTDRERDVFLLMARGRSNGEIAAELFISLPTVKSHVRHILAKLDLRDRPQAIVLAHECGLVADGAPR